MFFIACFIYSLYLILSSFRKGRILQGYNLSRNKSLRLPKIIENEAGVLNSTDDLFATRQASALAADKKFPKKAVDGEENDYDAELERVLKLPENASELVVITKAKKLGAYTIAITAKSPAKFRGVFVSRMQNFCLDAVQNMLNANFIRVEDEKSKKQREKFQADAIICLKMLAYIAMVAENAGCILKRQYKQIALQAGETINLALAWKKSDDEKWRNKKEI